MGRSRAGGGNSGVSSGAATEQAAAARQAQTSAEAAAEQATRDVQHQIVLAHRGETAPEPDLLRLAADILQEVVQQEASGYQWDVDGTRAVSADLRALAADAAQGEDDQARSGGGAARRTPRAAVLDAERASRS
ncbi:hypothetical protein AB0F17_54435 [Nonomuraea sp. NPDC026600]|uniref:hypothetical protein n=1 Tax=Nonomuraea sp. NPDC026600 TaxID=3155363 RepID=UPI0034106278